MIKRYKKMILNFTILVLLLSLTAYSCIGLNSNNNDELDQFQIVRQGDAGIGGSEFRIAQSFKPTLNTLTRVELLAEKMGDPSGYLQISIKNELNGDDLTFTVIPSINISSNGNWYEFDFPDIHVPPEYPLYIVWAPASNLWDDENQIVWGCNWQDNLYIRGEIWNEYPFGNWFIENPSWDCCFKTYGFNRENNPPNTPDIIGSNKGKANQEIQFNISCIDPDGDDVYYYIDWGDGIIDEWIGPYSSDHQVKLSHKWSRKGDYLIKIKSKDIFYEESEFTTFPFSIPKLKNYINFLHLIFKQLLPHFPIKTFFLYI
jgi:hypothetical protein